MQRSKIAVVILTQDNDLSEQTAQSNALRLFSDPDSTPAVALLRHTKADRTQKLNEWIERNLHDTDRLIILDTDQSSAQDTDALKLFIKDPPADICLCCDPAPKEKAFDANRKRYAAFLIEHSAVLIFAENALRRMRTADTTDLVEETISDPAVSAAFIPRSNGGSQSAKKGARDRVQRLPYTFNISRIWIVCAAAAVLGAAVFLLLMACGRFAAGLIGCIVCANLFFACLAALLIRWYRNSAKLERKKREHPYVEESHLK